MSRTAADMQTDFSSIPGGGSVSAEPAVCAAFAIDGVTPGCVLYPAAAGQAAEMLKCAAARGLGVVPCGNGTKLGFGGAPRRYDVALCLRGMNRVAYYEPDDLVISVEPGLEFGALQRVLDERRLWVPLDPPAGARATVGGILGSNSAGPLRLRYGGARDMVLGMKIATTDGQIVKTGGRVVKNVAGYDLAKLLIGSFGTLGVIVETTFKLHPQVRRRATWEVETAGAAAAAAFRRSLLRSPLRPLRAVLLNPAARTWLEAGAGAPARAPSAAVLIEAGGSEGVLARYDAELGRMAAESHATLRRAEPAAAAQAWARIADFGLGGHSAATVALKAALPIAAAEAFLESAGNEAEAERLEMGAISHLGVGVVHLAFLNERRAEPLVPGAAFINRLRLSAAGRGGALVITRCPAGLKSEVDVWGAPGDDFEVMRKLKAAWDPKGVLAPGRFVGGL